MKRYLGIDYGLARVGIAKSDLLGFTAQGIETINWDGEDIETVLFRVQDLCEEFEIDEIVLGLPKRTDNREGTAEIAAREFKLKLEERTKLPVNLQDERLTTVMATKFLQQGTSKKSSYRSKVDQVAAEIILQGYLEKLRYKRSMETEND